MQKLAVVVTCTDRKSEPVRPELRLRDLGGDDAATRVRHWDDRLRVAAPQRQLASLYQGEHWVQVKALPAAASRAGFAADLWVASAGLGLQPITAQAPAYGATFARRHEDSVAADGAGRRQWWHALQAQRGVTTLPDLARTHSLLLILSEDYSHALQNEVAAAAGIAGDTLLIGGADDVPGLDRLPADRRLRLHLGGTLLSLNVRTALAWLDLLTEPTLTSSTAKQRWAKWSASAAREEVYDRQPLSDHGVRAFIAAARAQSQRPSRTSLLKALRSAGYACEQSRFARLYADVAHENGWGAV